MKIKYKSPCSNEDSKLEFDCPHYCKVNSIYGYAIPLFQDGEWRVIFVFGIDGSIDWKYIDGEFEVII